MAFKFFLGTRSKLNLSLALIAALLSASTTCPAMAENTVTAKSKIEYQRLPANCRPERYDLYFEPDLETAEFEGTETLFFTLDRASNEIVLNAADLSVFEASIAQTKPTHGDWIKAEIVKDAPGEKVILKLPKALKSGQYELSLKFNGRLSKKMEGFYLSTFKDKDGKELRIATTQMEPTDARRMFPCFDEPAYKAAFKVTVAIDPTLSAISNAGVEFEKVDQRKNKKVVTFKATPRMSTYLFALIVGPFQSTEAAVVNGKKIRVWYTAGKELLAPYALSAAAKLLPYYENYFGQPYPLDKLDLIAIPDFSAGAMENLGAITFRESALLVDEKNSALSSRMRVVNIVAHEMAHLWFGDLVTMKWWDDLWLNEAFATWMADKAEDFLRPDWRIWDDFAVERVGTLDSDAITATRSVQSPVNSPNDALEMFDEITYSKGAALLRMLETYLGEDKFQKGIQAYMKAHAFNNASTEDLWNSLSSATDGKINVAKLMDTWVHSPGCPLVSFDAKTPTNLVVTQTRFFLNSDEKVKPAQPWQVPLMLKNEKSSEAALLSSQQAKLTVKFKAALINGTGNGYFRTGYSASQLELLHDQALLKQLNVSERVSVLSDVMALAVAGKLPLNDYLSLTQVFAQDQDPYVLGVLIGQLGQLDAMVDEPSRMAFQTYVRKVLKPQLERLTYLRKDSDDDLTAEVRARLIRTLGTIGGDPEVIAFCREKFETYLSNVKSLDGDMLSPIVQVVAYNGGSTEFARIEEAWRKSVTPEERNRNLFALAAFRDQSCIDKALNLSLDKDVRAQDAPHFMGRIISAQASQQQGFKFLGEHWQELYDKVGERKMPDIVEACSSFNKPGQLATLKQFIDSHPMPSGRRSAAKTIEFATIGTNFRAKQGNTLAQFFAGK